MVNVRPLSLSTVLCLLATTPLSSAQEDTTSTAATATATETPQKIFKIYHSLGQTKPFIPRGTITFSTESNVVGEKSDGKDLLTTVVDNEKDCFGESALQDIDELVSEGGFYRIKIVDEEKDGESVLASVPGCEVKRANFREEITLSMSQTGSLLSLSYTPLVSPLAAECHELPPLSSSDREYTFQTLLSYTTATAGMTLPKILPQMRPPPGLNAIKYKPTSGAAGSQGSSSSSPSYDSVPNPGRNSFSSEEEEEKKKQQENQSFFRRYWYIILPLTIMTLFGGEDPAQLQHQQQQQRQRQSAGAVPSVSASVAAATAATTATKQRRGKRG